MHCNTFTNVPRCRMGLDWETPSTWLNGMLETFCCPLILCPQSVISLLFHLDLIHLYLLQFPYLDPWIRVTVGHGLTEGLYGLPLFFINLFLWGLLKRRAVFMRVINHPVIVALQDHSYHTKLHETSPHATCSQSTAQRVGKYWLLKNWPNMCATFGVMHSH